MRERYGPFSRRSRGVREALDVAGNSAVGIGVLILVDNTAGLGLGTPAGLGGLLAAVGMIFGGLASVFLPGAMRRRRSGLLAELRVPRRQAQRFVA